MSECVFCRIVRHEIPASIVYEDDQTIVFMDIGSVNAGHMLVAVKPHVQDIFGLEPELAAAVFRTTARVAQAAKRALSPDGLSLFQANGEAGFQTVFHFHIHVLPRWKGDAMGLRWPARNPPREALEQVAAQLRDAL